MSECGVLVLHPHVSDKLREIDASRKKPSVLIVRSALRSDYEMDVA